MSFNEHFARNSKLSENGINIPCVVIYGTPSKHISVSRCNQAASWSVFVSLIHSAGWWEYWAQGNVAWTETQWRNSNAQRKTHGVWIQIWKSTWNEYANKMYSALQLKFWAGEILFGCWFWANATQSLCVSTTQPCIIVHRYMYIWIWMYLRLFIESWCGAVRVLAKKEAGIQPMRLQKWKFKVLKF